MSLENAIRLVDDPATPTLQASKWLQLPLLINALEMEELFHEMGSFYIVRVGNIISLEEALLPTQKFLIDYKNYVEALKHGKLPDLPSFKRLCSVVITSSLETLFACSIAPHRYIIKIAKPVIQVQAHALYYSSDDEKFRSMVFGFDSVTWGVQFTYPQIYQDPETMEIEKVSDQDNHPNNQLFQSIRNWQRNQTIPTPFIVNAKKINASMRIGKQCLPWINRHPQLVSRQIQVFINEGNRHEN